MFGFTWIVHVLLCICMVGLVLVQHGKGADAGAIMGGSGDSIIGAGSAGNFLSRLTTGLAVAFMISSIVMVKYYGGGVYISKEPKSRLEGSRLLDEEAPASGLPAVEVTTEEGAPIVPAEEGDAPEVAPPVALPDGAAAEAVTVAPVEVAEEAGEQKEKAPAAAAVPPVEEEAAPPAAEEAKD